MPVQRSTILAISSSVTFSCTRALSPLLLDPPLLLLQLLLQLRQTCRISARRPCPDRSSARQLLDLTVQVLNVLAELLNLAPWRALFVLPLGLLGIEAAPAPRPAPCESEPDGSLESSSSSFFRDCLLNLQLDDRARIHAVQLRGHGVHARCGSWAQASSIRSMALSGRNRSVIYRLERVAAAMMALIRGF